ncbi:hypothetical protein [Caudoviricetes sp.]|nr:hypothetical protein [Caudoviricetes sp.]
MKWKSVKEYPLPRGDGKKQFLVSYQSHKGERHSTVWGSPEDHPKMYYDDEHNPAWEITHWLEIVPPDENKPADSVDDCLDELRKVAAGPEFDKIMNNALRSSVKILDKEPSWEERFRWETARDVLHRILKNKDHVETVKAMTSAIEFTDYFISELKKGRGE